MKKIICRIFGGIGNQLFSYSAAQRLAIANDFELVIDDISGFTRDHAYQRTYQLDNFNIPCRRATTIERLEPFSRIRRHLKREWNRLLPFEQRTYLTQEGVDFDPRLLKLKLENTVYLEGYWQSENYFKDIEAVIRQNLLIEPPTDLYNLTMAEKISKKTAIAVHVRFFDDPNKTTTHNVCDGYYRRAIEEMEKNITPSPHYFIFSDKPKAAQALIPIGNDRTTLITHNQGNQFAYADLWLMTKCQHFIIANSTFSWWGAWLAKNPEKKVISPMKTGGTVTTWGFKGLIPTNWQCL